MKERVEVPVNLTEVPLAARTVIGAKVSGVIDIGRMEKEEPLSTRKLMGCLDMNEASTVNTLLTAWTPPEYPADTGGGSSFLKVSVELVYCESSDVDMCNLLGTLLL